MKQQDETKKRGKGGRPRGDPADVRTITIGVRVSSVEFDLLKAKAEHMGATPAHWLREAAISRRLPPPPVPEINREQYVELAHLSANLNQLAKAANEGRAVVDSALLERAAAECSRLRLALIGGE
jgi:hypothetical protein